MKTFKNKEALKIGWQKTKENLWFLVGLEILVYLVNFIAGSTLLGFLISIISGLVLTQVLFRLSRHDKVHFKNLFAWLSADKIAHYILASLIATILVLVGLVLLVVPGIIIAIMTVFIPFILLEKDYKPSWKELSFWRVIKDSARLTKGVRWKIFVFFLVCALINILGILALGVGLLITVPVTGIALAAVYNKLKGHSHHTQEAEIVK